MKTPKQTPSSLHDLIIREAVATYLIEMDMDIPNQLQDSPFRTGPKADEKTGIASQHCGKVESSRLPVANEANDEDADTSGTCTTYCSSEWEDGPKSKTTNKVKAAKKSKTIYLGRFKPPVRAAKKPEVKDNSFKPPHSSQAKDDEAVIKREVKDPPKPKSKTTAVQLADVSRFQDLLNLDWDEKELVVLLVRRFAPNASGPVSNLTTMQIVSKLRSARNSKSE